VSAQAKGPSDQEAQLLHIKCADTPLQLARRIEGHNDNANTFCAILVQQVFVRITTFSRAGTRGFVPSGPTTRPHTQGQAAGQPLLPLLGCAIWKVVSTKSQYWACCLTRRILGASVLAEDLSPPIAVGLRSRSTSVDRSTQDAAKQQCASLSNARSTSYGTGPCWPLPCASPAAPRRAQW
jgi:hypothetical protein